MNPFIQNNPNNGRTYSLFIPIEQYNQLSDEVIKLAKSLSIWSASISGKNSFTHKGWEFDAEFVSKDVIIKLFNDLYGIKIELV